jgi:hypothetical protein
MEDHTIQSYLAFGAAYGDLRKAGYDLLSTTDTTKYRKWAANASESELVRQGVQCLREAAREALADVPGGTQAVLLSGGYDSRGVLGALLENVSASEIVALTYGTPGSLDYEVPQSISKLLGIRHERLDLNTLQWDAASIVRYVRDEYDSSPVPMAVDTQAGQALRSRVGTDATYWTGFMGDTTAGGHLPRERSKDWDSAVDFFLERNREAKSVVLTRPGWEARTVLPSEPIFDPAAISLDDQLVIAGRLPFRIRPVAGHRHRHSYVYSQPAWASFMLALPWKQRAAGKRLYRRILLAAFPRLFSLPLQGNYGLGANASASRLLVGKVLHRGRRAIERVAPSLAPTVDAANVQKLHYSSVLRGDSDYARLVKGLVHSLHDRGVLGYIDVRTVWNDHARGIANHASALRLLASLEVSLRAAEDP